jgi:hypothetical protein
MKKINKKERIKKIDVCSNETKSLSLLFLLKKFFKRSQDFLEEYMIGNSLPTERLKKSCEFPECGQMAFVQVRYGRTGKGFYSCCEHIEEFEKPCLLFVGFLP